MQDILNAISSDDLEGLKAILQDKRKVRAKNERGSTCLHIASYLGKLDAAREIFSHRNVVKIDIDDADIWGYTPLHNAAYNNHAEVVQFLLRRGADINACNKKNMTPLHLAVMRGHMPVVQELVQRTAHIDALNDTDCTPLHLAILYAHTPIAIYLIDRGADGMIENRFGENALLWARKHNNHEVIEAIRKQPKRKKKKEEKFD